MTTLCDRSALVEVTFAAQFGKALWGRAIVERNVIGVTVLDDGTMRLSCTTCGMIIRDHVHLDQMVRIHVSRPYADPRLLCEVCFSLDR